MIKTIAKKKEKSLSANPEELALAEQVELFADLAKSEKEAKAVLAAITKQRKKLSDLFLAEVNEAYTPEQTGELEGDTYVIEFGAAHNTTKINDKAKLRKLLGEENYFTLANIGIGDAREYLNPEEQKQVFETTRTSNRTLKLVEKA